MMSKEVSKKEYFSLSLDHTNYTVVMEIVLFLQNLLYFLMFRRKWGFTNRKDSTKIINFMTCSSDVRVVGWGLDKM